MSGAVGTRVVNHSLKFKVVRNSKKKKHRNIYYTYFPPFLYMYEKKVSFRSTVNDILFNALTLLPHFQNRKPTNWLQCKSEK